MPRDRPMRGACCLALTCLLACGSDPARPNVVIPGAGSAAEPGAGASGSAGSSGSSAGTTAGSGSDAGSNDCGPIPLTFNADVRPIVSRCTGCHDDGGESGLDARSLAGLLRGGDHGPAVVPNDCANSLIWQKTGPMPPFGGRMPAGGSPLSDAQRDVLCQWIDEGAVESAPACMNAAGSGGTAGTDPSGDITPPSFEGADEVDEQDDGCTVSWEAAEDDVSASSAIVYELFAVPEGEAIDYGSPVLTTAAGETSAFVPLPPGSDYEIAVIARDEAGNRDANDRTRECSLR